MDELKDRPAGGGSAPVESPEHPQANSGLPSPPPSNQWSFPASAPQPAWSHQAGPPARRGPPIWVWVIGGIAALFVGLIVVAISVPTFLGARQRAQERAATKVDAGKARLVAPTAIDGIARNQSPQVQRLAGDAEAQAKAAGMTNGFVAVYGPDARGRAFTLSAARMSNAGMRRDFGTGAWIGLSNSIGLPNRQSSSQSYPRGKIDFSCAPLPANKGSVSAVCTWDDGDTAGFGAAYGSMPPTELADVLAKAVAAMGA